MRNVYRTYMNYLAEPIRMSRFTLLAVVGLALGALSGGWFGLILVLVGLPLVAIDYWIENR